MAEQEYVLEYLGSIPGWEGQDSRARAVSADGAVVVGEIHNGDNSYIAFRWTQATGMVDLGTLGGVGANAAATGVSADGSVIVGWAPSSPLDYSAAFRWTEAGGMVNLGTLGGSYHAYADGCSSDGNVVFGRAPDASSMLRPFLWDAVNGMVEFTAAGSGAAIHAVSGNGSVVVGVAPNAGMTEAFRWSSAGGLVFLGKNGRARSTAVAVSDDGEVVAVVTHDMTTPAYGFDGTSSCTWTSATGLVDIGSLGNSGCIIFGTSPDGAVAVGGSPAPAGPSVFTYTAAEGIVAVSFGGSRPAEVRDSTVDAAYIVGAYDYKAYRAYPLPPPPPPVPNDSAPIEFEPLVSSPETMAESDTVLSLSRLQAIGKEVPGNYGAAVLPRLSSSAAGVTQDNVDGTGVGVLAALSALGTRWTVGRLVDVTGYSATRLPAIVVTARDEGSLVPQAGWGNLSLPLFNSTADGGESLRGASVLPLPALQGFALEGAGAYGVATLPAIRTTGREAYAVPENRMLLVQPAGAMAIMAGNTYTVVRDETASFVSDPIGVAIGVLREQIALRAMPNPMLLTRAVLSDDAAFYDALGVAWKLLLQEEVALIGAATATPTRLASVIDTLSATGLVSPRADAVVVVASAIALNSLLAAGWRETAVDTVAFQDALGAAVRVATQLAETASFTDVATPQIRMTAVVTDAVALEGGATASMELLAKMSDSVLFHAALRFGDDEYVGWVLNEGAPSQYTNYPFNGMTTFGHRYVGTADDGIYLLEGDDDAGDPIEAHVKTALMDFGSGVNKRLPDVYVAFAGGNKLVCKVVTSHPRTGQKLESVYESTIPPGAELHNGRIKLGQGLESRYWQFTLSNVDGANFDLDELTFRPLFLDRRL